MRRRDAADERAASEATELPAGERSAADEEPPDGGPMMSGPTPLEELDVTVLGEGGAGVAGAEVVLFENHPHGGYDAWRRTSTVVTDTAGKALVSIGGGNAVRVSATHGELMDSGLSMDRFHGARRRELTLRLSPGMRVRGRVRDADSLRPVAGAQLDLFSAPWAQTVETDADGRFVSGVVHQDAVLRVVFTSGFNVRAEGYVADAAQLAFEGDGLELIIRRATRLTFRLVRPDGLPAVRRGGYVELGREIPRARFDADARGRVQVDVRLDAGTPFEVWPDDGEILRFPAHPARPSNLDLGELAVHPCGEVSGVVVNAAGAPVYRARVEIHAAEGGYLIDVESTDLDGEFELTQVGRGPHVVTVTRWHDENSFVRLEDVLAGTTNLRAILATHPDDD